MRAFYHTTVSKTLRKVLFACKVLLQPLFQQADMSPAEGHISLINFYRNGYFEYVLPIIRVGV
jgi:hypothetical protein